MPTTKEQMQADFNAVWDWFIVQEHEQSVNDDGACMYRQGELRCAVGVLIPDELYNETMEDVGICALTDDKYTLPHEVQDIARIREFLSGHSATLLIRMQNAHDLALHYDFRRQFRKAMIKIADDFGLIVPEDKG